jgi:cytochrome c oxidase subunit II
MKTGKYELACAELCGSGHYSMRGVLNMQSDEDFNKWMNTKIESRRQAMLAQAAQPKQPEPAPAAAAAGHGAGEQH